MEIVFKDERLKRDCTIERWMKRAWGANRSLVLRRRLDQLRAVEHLDQMRLVHRRTHELVGDQAGRISLDLDGGHRLIIEPAENPPPRKVDGGLDWTRITAVRIVAVEDTHA